MKAIIFFDQEFPRQGPDSNYVYYFALSLIDCGYDIEIVGESVHCENDFERHFFSKNITYYNVPMKNRLFRFYRRFISYRKYSKIENLCEEDVVFFYTEYGSKIRSVIKNNALTVDRSILISVEWLKAFYARRGVIDLRYFRFKYFERVCNKYIKKVIPISTKLQDYYRLKGCDTCLLPVMCDPYEIPEYSRKKRQVTTFIYSGIALEKENYEDMFRTMVLLFQKNKNIKLVLTNCDEEKLREIVDYELFSSISAFLTIYSWLPYDEYVKVLEEADYLLVFRNDNVITRSNMPSKVLEAMARGIVPILLNGGDLEKIYLSDGRDSILLNKSDRCLLYAEKIWSVIEKPEEYYVAIHEGARKTSENEFYYKKWSSKIAEFITKKVSLPEDEVLGI